jgi:hypothetical protein
MSRGAIQRFVGVLLITAGFGILTSVISTLAWGNEVLHNSYCAPDNSQTPCVTKANCPTGSGTYCDGNYDPVPGVCSGPATTRCNNQGASSCGNEYYCSNGSATTIPPSSCGTTVNPCLTLQ